MLFNINPNIFQHIVVLKGSAIMQRSITRNKQSLMADQNSSPVSSFLGSPRFFNGFLSKNLPNTETAVLSPTSVLDTKNSSTILNPFGHERNLAKPVTSKIREPKAIGLALIDSINEENTEKDVICPKPVNRMVLFGSKLKIQIPNIVPQLSTESPKDFTRQLSLKEMELSEEYTCVITHGPNPKTTHIYDDCVVDSWTEFPQLKNMECGLASNGVDFMSFCHTCKISLGQGKDIYIYRGDKAFCSEECRDQEILFQEMKNPMTDTAF